jgi:hypothetical protein
MSLKRFFVWFAETAAEGILFIFVGLLVGEEPVTLDGLRVLIFGTVLLLGASYYVVTTGIVATFFRNRTHGLYPPLAAVLFLVQVEYFVEGQWDIPQTPPGYVVWIGVVIVFVCSYAGGLFLRRTTAIGSSPKRRLT